jgi:hypothetical protein
MFLDGDHQFASFPSKEAENWKGLLIPGVELIVDHASLFDPTMSAHRSAPSCAGHLPCHHRKVWRPVRVPGRDTDQSSRRSPEIAFEPEGRVFTLEACAGQRGGSAGAV